MLEDQKSKNRSSRLGTFTLLKIIERGVLGVARREIRIRLKSRLFQFMTTSLFLLAIAPSWILNRHHPPNTSPSPISTRQILTIGILFTCYGIMVTTASLLSTGIVEEKSSRAIDLILTSISPSTFLSGKVLGISALGTAQTIFLALAALFSESLSTGNAINLPYKVIVQIIVWFLPSFVTFSLIVGYFSFRINKISDLGFIQLPVLIISAASLFSGVISVFSKLSTFISISRLLPFLGSFANPVFRSDKSSLTNSPVLHYLFLFSIYAIISIFLIKDFDRVATR